ncbi:unnamed protein product [Soboliphyme baturini]|uniref:KH domain-containing protein n=1 Tax=Soboliphyme baturini TaxID=241478 RepID=A0A183J0M3_9BILA|nr:unnamed protein product [Soboliphyme baturini]
MGDNGDPNVSNSNCSAVNCSTTDDMQVCGGEQHSSPAKTTSAQPQYSVEYLAQLLKDKKHLMAFPNIFLHLERLVDEEIAKVRSSLFTLDPNKEALVLPDPIGPIASLQEKVYVPVRRHPDILQYNFVGRILGPRGMTAKQLEQETGCKIMVRGRGSMRDKKKEEQNRGKPNWEHLNDDLHVLIQCEDAENRAKIKVKRAVEEITKLLVPAVSSLFLHPFTYYILQLQLSDVGQARTPSPCLSSCFL